MLQWLGETQTDVSAEGMTGEPNHPLLIEEGTVMTRADVERATALLSDALLSLVRPGQLVGSLIHRGLEAALLLLAANRSGVPITFFDRSLPENEWRRVIEGAECALLVSAPGDGPLAARLGSGRVPTWEVRPDEWASLPALSTVVRRTESDAPAIVVFSSGTTGDPKGVIRSIVALRRAGDNFRERHDLGDGDVLGDLASFRFVTSSGTTYGALCSGAAVSFHAGDGDGLASVAEWAVRTGVTVLRMQAALMRTLIELETDLRGSRVRAISIAGETLFGSELERLRALLPPGCEIVCAYGSSEGGGIASARFPAGTAIPAGRIRFPRPAHVRIVDENLEVVRDGEVGEIVSTKQQSAGYWKKPTLTSERYIPVDDGTVLYRTGDLGRFADGDTLEVLGRSDSQVKVRGQNVELTEIEGMLLEHPDVRTAAVVDVPRHGGGTSMIAFFTPAAGKLPATGTLRRHLGERLPAYKIPARFVVLDRLPTTPAGKIDRSRLRTSSADGEAERDLREPRTLVESALVEQMRRLLGTEELGIDDDFFDMGGDSLSAIEFAVWASRRFGIHLSTTVLVANPTAVSLARQIERQDARHEKTIGILRDCEEPVATLVLVAGGGDSIVSQRPLSKAIRGEFRIIGVQGRGIDDRRRTETSVTAYAERAVRELLALDPTGPYMIGGHSFGGIVAQEMARQLELQNNNVLAVVVIDTAAPADRRPPGFLRSTLRRARGWRDEVRDRRLMFGVRHDRRETLRIRKGIVFAVHVRALRNHVARPCRAPILVIRAEGSAQENDQRFGRWAELTSGGLSVVSTPGTHVSIKDVPYVGGAAAHIDALFDDVRPCRRAVARAGT